MAANGSRLPRPMSLSRNASVILLTSLSFAVTGCNLEPSPAVEAGAKLKQTIDKASKLMAEAAVEDPEGNRTTAEALRSAAGSASAPAGATASQKAAFAMVSSQLQREAGRLDMVAAERAVSQMHHLTMSIRTAASAAQQLAFLSDMAGKGSSEAREQIQSLIDAKKVEISALEDAITKLTEASDTLGSTTTTKSADAKAKELEANGMRSKAVAKAGIDAASESMKQAIALHVEAAQAQMQLNQVNAELLFCKERLITRQSAVERLQRELTQLDDFDASRKSAATALRSEMDKEMENASAAAKALHALADGDAKALHESAAEALERAASLAQQSQSAPGDAGKSAKASAASAQLALARVCEQRALAAADAAAAFDAMAALASGGPWGGYASASRTERDQAVAKASESVEAAINVLPDSQDPVAVALRSRIDQAKVNLSNMKPAAPAAKPADSAPAAEAEAPATADAPAEKPADETPAAEPAPETPAAEPAAEPAPAPAR